MVFTMSTRYSGVSDVELCLSGEMLGIAPDALRVRVRDLILTDHLDLLVINVDQMTALGSAGIHALMSGYITAIEQGTSYRLCNAHGEVRRVLQLTGLLDVLADSDDVGALLLATLALDAPVPPASRGGPRRAIRRLRRRDRWWRRWLR
ncbi:STAS domain-containing protein [Amycolatopsis lexingtonensis]|uniref:STAS domain-containing protein n=1 Tax=Amycolatopsis lexingtonensis TaxID=218822 RepID=UPI003F7046CD